MPNGLCFNYEGTKLYVTDTGLVQRRTEGENITIDSTGPATMCVVSRVSNHPLRPRADP